MTESNADIVAADDAARARRQAANAPAALLAQLGTAMRFLTVVPVPGRAATIGESTLFFPLVGLALGGVLVGVDHLLAAVVPLTVRDLLIVSVLVMLTGGLHLRGLATSVTGLVVDDRARALATIREGRMGSLGAAAVVVALVLQLVSLGALAPTIRTPALLYAPMLARWSMVVLGFGSRPARPDGLGSEIVRAITFREFGIATVSALWIMLANNGARGLVAILVVAVTTVSGRILLHARLGGITGSVLNGIATVTEVLVLGIFALAIG